MGGVNLDFRLLCFSASHRREQIAFLMQQRDCNLSRRVAKPAPLLHCFARLPKDKIFATGNLRPPMFQR